MMDDKDVFMGFHETYRRIGESSTTSIESYANSVALAELLISKGIVGMDELDRRRREVERRMVQQQTETRTTVQLGDGPPDKYDEETTVKIDCSQRLHLCRAACCRLRFALTEQDIHEGSVEWEITEPYLNRQREDGYWHPLRWRVAAMQRVFEPPRGLPDV